MKSREVWMPVRGYEGRYEASNLGRIRRDPMAPPRSGASPGVVLKPSVTQGYLHVSLCCEDGVQTHRVHRLVMEAFCGAAPFEGAQVCHNDGVTANCALENLRWDTAYGNQADVDRHGHRPKGSQVFGSKLQDDDVIEIRKLIAAGQPNPPIAKRFGISVSTVHLIRHRRIWKHIE